MRNDHWTREFFESTRGQVALCLRRGRATVEEIARALALTHNAVRSHLTILARDGIVRAAGVRRTEGAGKPATLYELAPEAEPMFSRAYVPLLQALLGAVTDLPTRSRERVIRAAAHRLAARAPVSAAGSMGGAERAARLLEGFGGLVEIVPDASATVIQGGGCPVSALVAEHPGVCGLVQALLTEVSGMEVREACRRGERPQCRFVLSEPRRASRG